MDMVDGQRGALSEVSADVPSISVWISKRIQIWDGRQKVAVEIQKTLCGGRNTYNFIKSTCFYIKISPVHMFVSNYSQVCIFCDDEHLKLVTESVQPVGVTN